MDTRTSGVAESALSLPKGAGALAPLGEAFKVDFRTGGGSFTVPLDLPEGRGGLGPKLSLQYSTGHGNGPFGLGWRIGIGDVSRKTSEGTPIYDDDRDTYVFSGGEDLVPLGSGLYRPCVEGLFARIQRVPAPDGIDCFVVTTRDGVRHTFGEDAGSRLVHLARPGAIFRWMPSVSVEPNGSRMVYRYRHEDADGTAALASEINHRHHQIYLSTIEYVDYDPGDGSEVFLFRVRFDYGDLDEVGEPAGAWTLRTDPFSDYRAGFEIRTLRRCRRILLQARPPGSDSYQLIRSWRLEYEESVPDGVSMLSSVTLVGRQETEAVEEESYPPLTFGYSAALFDHPRLIPIEGAPGAFIGDSLASPDVDLIDMTGNGLPDLISLTSNDPLYWENRGAGRFIGPRRLQSFPLEARRRGVDRMFADIDGSASADIWIQDGSQAAYYRNRFRAGFEDPVYVAAAPNLRVPDRQFLPMEMNGDGAVDFLALSPDRRLYFHASEPAEGGRPRRTFSSAAAARLKPTGAGRLEATAPARFRLADMTGDGRMALVFLSSGAVTYRPYLGNGTWGDAIVMENSPVWPNGLDANFVFLADLTGSGCADLIVLDGRQVLWAVNQSGNRFGNLRTLVHTPPVDANAIRAADLLGTGASGLVMSLFETQAGVRRHRFLDLTGGTLPRLLNRIDNGFGGLVEVTYRSAVEDWLRDEQSGNRLPLTLPMPVPVVASTSTHDVLSGAHAHVDYQYHGGFFDGRTREFRGFCLTEEFESGDESIAGALRRTWFHPGTERNLAGELIDLSSTFQAPSALFHSQLTLPAGALNDAEARIEAFRSAKGLHLRTEVYALVGDAPLSNPLVVTESAYRIVEVEPPAPGRHGVYTPQLAETVMARDEGEGDPRKLRRTEFETDHHGNITLQRISGGPETADAMLPVVQTIEETRRFHVRNDADPAPDLTAPYQLTYQVDRVFEVIFEEVEDGARRLLSHMRTYYDGPDFTGQALTVLPVRGNPVRQEQLALTDDLIAEAWGAAVSEEVLAATALVPEGAPGSRRWWRQVDRRRLNARGLATVVRGPLGSDCSIEHDTAFWKVVATTSEAGHTQRIILDYQALGVAHHVDANLNETEYRYSPLGRLRTIACRGRADSGGNFPGDSLAFPTVQFAHRLDRVDLENPVPVATTIISRLTTGSNEVERTIEYSDGSGEILQKRFQQRPGDIDGSQGLQEAWIVSGLKEHGARGLMRALHGPVLDDTSDFRVTQAMRDAPAGTVDHDALGRLIRGVAPDGSMRRIVHETWRTLMYDENDNAELTLDPIEPQNAALIALLTPQFNTPQEQTFDAYDRQSEVMEDQGGNQFLRTRYRFDALGRPIEVRDALDRVAIRATYDFTGQVIAFTQLDAGTHQFILNAEQSLILRIDGRGARLRTTHDGSGRIQELFELPSGIPISDAWDSVDRRLIVHYRYGSAADAAALAAHARSRLIGVRDPAGDEQYTYDHRGNRSSVTRRFYVSDPTAEIDPDAIPPSVETRMLEAEAYRIDYEHNAAGRLSRIVYPAVNGGARRAVRLERTRFGLLRQATYHTAVDDSGSPVIADTLYNARNARLGVWLGNGQAIGFQYSADQTRLTGITGGPAPVGTLPGIDPLFALAYDYDLIGNPISVLRTYSADVRGFAADGRASAEGATYTYDALHRLTAASVFDSLAGARQQRMRNYSYDGAGNLTAFGDREGPPSRLFAGTNRLEGFGAAADPLVEPLTYDNGGSVTSSSRLPQLVWDERGHLRFLSHTSGRVANYSYDFSGERRRKLVREGAHVRDVRNLDGIFEMETVSEGSTLLSHEARFHILGALEHTAIVVSNVLNDSERLLYLHGDHLTSVLCITDQAGAPVHVRDYLPYGLVAAAAGDVADRTYAGMGLDRESGLIYMRMRYYDPALGRFISPDPMMVKYLDGRNAQGIYRPSNLNPYGYAAANPLVYYDPKGGFIFIALIIAAAGLALAGIGYAMQQSDNSIVRGIGKAFEIIGLVAAGAALGAIGGAFLAGLGAYIFTSASLGVAFAGTLGATTFGALSTAGIVGAIAGGVIGAAHGAITGAFGVYDLGSPTGYLAFILDTTWGLSQTTIGVFGVTIAGIGGGSVNRGLSDRTNVLAMENANIAGGGLSLGPYIFAGQTFASDPELFRHESFHTLQNRIFGPIFTYTVIPLTIISTIMTAIGRPGSNPDFVDASEPPNFDNWINWWEAWGEAEV